MLFKLSCQSSSHIMLTSSWDWPEVVTALCVVQGELIMSPLLCVTSGDRFNRTGRITHMTRHTLAPSLMSVNAEWSFPALLTLKCRNSNGTFYWVYYSAIKHFSFLLLADFGQFITHDMMQTPDMAGDGPDPCNCKRDDVCINVFPPDDEPVIKLFQCLFIVKSRVRNHWFVLFE